MRVIVHGGMHKTGTTSLQAAMAAAVDLEKMGIFYPRSGGPQHGALLNLKQAAWSPELLRAARRAAEHSRAHTLFLSAEGVSTFSADQLRQIRSALPEDDVTFLFCFRHWHAFWPSRWAQNCSRRDTQGFAAYLDMISQQGLPHTDLHYAAVLERALAVPDAKVVAVSFDRAVASPEGLLASLLSAAGLASGPTSAVMSKERALNRRSPWQIVEITRLLNGIVASIRNLPQNALCGYVPDHRPVDQFFDLGARLGRLEPGFSHALVELMDRHAVTVTADQDGERIAEATEELSHFSALFSNVPTGPIFLNAPRCEVRTTDLDWAEFYARHRGLADTALKQMQLLG